MSDVDRFQRVSNSGVELELWKKHPAYPKARQMAKELCTRIRQLRPYVLRGAQFMYDNEKAFGLPAEVRIQLSDEKAWAEKLDAVWDGRRETWREAAKEVKDPFAEYTLLLSFPYLRGGDGFHVPGKLRVITLYLYSNARMDYDDIHLGIAFMDLDKFECGA